MTKRVLLGLLALFLFSEGKASENLSQLDADARLLVLDSTNTSRQRYTDTQIYEYLNQAQRLAISQSYCLQQNIVFQLTPGTTYYTLPANYEEITRVTIGSKYIPQQSVAALDGKSRGWEAASGYPTYYFINFSSRSLIGFAPFPMQASDTDTIKVEYSIAPTDMVNPTDLPFNGINELQVYDHLLAYYAGSIMSGINSIPDLAKNYMDMYMQGIGLMSKRCNSQSQYLPSAAGSP